MAKPINLPNGRSWNTQTDALAYFKEMLAELLSREPLSTASRCREQSCSFLIKKQYGRRPCADLAVAYTLIQMDD